MLGKQFVGKRQRRPPVRQETLSRLAITKAVSHSNAGLGAAPKGSSARSQSPAESFTRAMPPGVERGAPVCPKGNRFERKTWDQGHQALDLGPRSKDQGQLASLPVIPAIEARSPPVLRSRALRLRLISRLERLAWTAPPSRPRRSPRRWGLASVERLSQSPGPVSTQQGRPRLHQRRNPLQNKNKIPAA